MSRGDMPRGPNGVTDRTDVPVSSSPRSDAGSARSSKSGRQPSARDACCGLRSHTEVVMSKTVTASAALALAIVLAMPWQATAERSAHDTPAAPERAWTGYREAGDVASVSPQDV